MSFQYIVLPAKSAYSKVFSVKPEPITTLWFMLHKIVDPRRPQGKRHDLPTLLTLAILAICCGQESYLAMHEWSVNYQEMLSTHVSFLRGHMPDASTFQRVFARLDQRSFEEVIGQWLQAVVPTEKGEGLAMDGKSLHGTGFHLVAAFSHIAKGVLFEMGTQTKGKGLFAKGKTYFYFLQSSYAYIFLRMQWHCNGTDNPLQLHCECNRLWVWNNYRDTIVLSV